jgi:SAM-dependent methyltransferase
MTYEIENRAVDPDGVIESAMAAIAPWVERSVLDVGCGTGFHLPRFASSAARVVGVEPHPSLAALARRRTRRLGNVEVRDGLAQALPLCDASIDLVHARWAYFFGPGCEPGLAELDRVVRRGGTAFVVDTDPTRSTFGAWFRRGYPMVDPAELERFWSSRGWIRHPLLIGWQFGSRADFEAVLTIELPTRVARDVVASYDGLFVDCAVNLWSRSY